jgi:hypothetical protein
MATVSDELLELLAHMPESEQRHVLAFARSLSRPFSIHAHTASAWNTWPCCCQLAHIARSRR